ncbi:Flagellar biosynthetic protein fliR [Candidatus Terasakiella magnetica]|uniref:Flagellar biosynthetic protein fliR n=1 Tax=Candidatus Terasakiella magnetica TaxID=1867952 RepID=A0A1C3RKX2_9PROT|nr:flagellar biosynthetic protein FliR [Candidatus Terasakiella magnetica]SCA57905.1 Flagellar biosynthetic protein fliR [Candidatus Terasakiella magnetica]
MLSEIFTFNIFHFGLIFARMSGALIVMPGISASFVSVRVRLMLGLMLAFILVPAVSENFPPFPIHPLELMVLLGGEILVGFFFGMLMAIMLSAMHVLGTIIAFVASLSNAFSFDAVSQAQGSIIATFFVNLALITIFVTDLHHLMLTAIVDSYSLFEPGKMPPIGDFASFMTRTVADAFKIGVELASPFILMSFGFQLSMGLISRLNPQFQVYFVAMPAQILLALLMLMFTISGIMMVFLTYYQNGLIGFLEP